MVSLYFLFWQGVLLEWDRDTCEGNRGGIRGGAPRRREYKEDKDQSDTREAVALNISMSPSPPLLSSVSPSSSHSFLALLSFLLPDVRHDDTWVVFYKRICIWAVWFASLFHTEPLFLSFHRNTSRPLCEGKDSTVLNIESN